MSASFASIEILNTDDLYPSGAQMQMRNDGPRYYFINPACARWMIRTGRPMMEWLWNDDMDTRLEEENP